MSSIDQRIVDMTFKSADFVKNVNTTISALQALKDKLNFKGAEDSLNNLDSAGKRFSLAGMESGVSNISSKFSALGVIGISALATVASKAVSAGITLVKAFTIDPIRAGLDVYETKINAIQTILANTSAEGTNLKQVNAALNQLNTYANQTVYNFGQMAKNIGTFTAAGVDLKTSVASIKGIANLAALSGSSAEQASTAMYQLSQAIANGKVNLQDWNSVVNAGLGGKVFQNALVETARATGVNIDAIIKKSGSFRNSLQQGWLTSKILTETLSTFTGDLSAAQLKAMGFTDKEAAAIQKQGQIAVQSATQIRTVSQLTQALKEELATAWGSVFQAIIGNSTQAASSLSSLHTIAENALTKPIYALAKILQQFTDLGGRQIVIQAISNAFHAFSAVLSTIGAAFKEVFPSNGSGATNALLSMAKAFERFTAAMLPSKKTLGELKTIFVGVFSVVKIVIDVIAALFGGLTKIGGASTHASGGFLALLATIASFVTNIRKAIESSNILGKVFNTLGSILSIPIKLLGSLGSGAAGAVGKLSPVLDKIKSAFGGIGKAIANAVHTGDFSNVLNIVNQLLTGGLLLTIRGFFKNLTSATPKTGILTSIKDSFEGLTKTLTAMQQNLKSGTLLKIAGAVALLTASVVALSFINPGNLAKALTALTIMFTQLLAGMAIVGKISASSGIVKMAGVSASLILLSVAILILAGAVAILAQFSWTELAKGLGSIIVILGALVIATNLMGKGSGGLVTASAAMVVMAVALNLMAIAVGTLGKMDISSLAKGVGTIAALLLVITGFQKISGGSNLIATAASMILLGAALNIIAAAIQTLGALSLSELAKGVGAIAASLLVIAAAMLLMPPDLPLTATGLLITAAALVVLSSALTTMGGMTWGEIAAGLVVLAGSLLIIAGAMFLMTGALPGAAALLVVAASLAILTPILLALGAMSWGTILTALGALAGVFLILGLAGLLLAPVIPVLLGLGLAITLIGIGVLAAGVGVAAFAVGLTALAAALTVSGLAIVAFVSGILGLIPLAGKELGLGIIALANAIGNGGQAIEHAFQAIVTGLLNAIIAIVPKIAQTVQVILTSFLNLINRNAGPILATMANLLLRLLNTIAAKLPSFINAGVNIIVGLLNGIARNVPRMATAGGNLVIAFINAIGTQAGRIAAAGINMVINLVNNVANSIRNNSGRMNAAGRNLASAIIDGIISGITGGIGGVLGAIGNIASSALAHAKSILHINSPSIAFMRVFESVGEGAALGIDNNADMVISSVENMATNALDTMKNSLSGIGNMVVENIDLQPKITPVIDLTQAKKGFGDLSTLSKSQLASVSTNKATSISADNAAAAAAFGSDPGVPPAILNYNQYNTSPKALSTADIYRQTKNQLSTVKEALPK